MIRWLILLCVITVMSCKGNKRPAGILDEKQMQLVLWDILRADEVTNYYQMSDSTFATLEKHAAIYHSIFQLHHTTRPVFIKSLHYYEENPDKLKPVLDSLQATADKAIKVVAKLPFTDTLPKKMPGLKKF
jgi:hypothetical protein